ncbi:hypothetical protein FVR03_16775 [Pontibacter qinzhouensis]|uniref:Uncharacterized protein n=1 Tax=Pontibacter qinzhouensis TaxID=2603253 RepID=A0A5C8JIG3_9BACT|nr:hypothetical protein [Pontibacter qinzhouensis]TXK36796.1 hypothetical protein FVR03_16775 [Pontibacter qinzhouensis]
MKTIKFNKVKYTIPENWSEVPFKQFKEIMKLERQKLGDLERSAKIVAVFTGLSYDSLVDGDPHLVYTLMNNLSFFDTPVDELEPVLHFKIGDSTYYVNDLENGTYREFADYGSIDKIFSDNPEEGITKKLAVFCRKANEKPLKDNKTIDERSNIFENLDTETVLKINSFFLLKQKVLQVSSQQYSNLEKQVREKEQELRRLMTLSGGGMRWLTKWLNMLLTFRLFMIRRLKIY